MKLIVVGISVRNVVRNIDWNMVWLSCCIVLILFVGFVCIRLFMMKLEKV